MSSPTFPAIFTCPHCQTEETLRVDQRLALRHWICAACRLRAVGRPMRRERGISGLVWWLGDQLVDDLGAKHRAVFRECLIEALAPTLADATERLCPREEVADFAVDVVLRVLCAVRGLDAETLSEGGRRLLAWARAGDAAALHACWRPRVEKTKNHDEDIWGQDELVAAMLEGPPSAYKRSYGCWFGHVITFLFVDEGGLCRLVDMSWWEGRWQGPPRPGHPEDAQDPA